mgnify:CR=1 FL=1
MCIPQEREQELTALVAQQQETMRRELSATGDKITVQARPTQKPEWCSQPDRFLAALLLAPDGIYQMNETLVGLVDTSDNMGECYLDQNGLRLVFEVRSARDSLADYLCQRIQQLLRRVKVRKTLRKVDGIVLVIDAGHAADDRIRECAHTVT